MRKTPMICLVAVATLTSATAQAATIVNKDGQAHMLLVTEAGQQSEVGIGPGESLNLCASGCFITMPNGDREALSGGETLEINGGKATIR